MNDSEEIKHSDQGGPGEGEAPQMTERSNEEAEKIDSTASNRATQDSEKQQHAAGRNSVASSVALQGNPEAHQAAKRQRVSTKKKIQIEVCCDSIASVKAAEQGGASRIELCTSLVEGGITPSLGLLLLSKSQCRLPIRVLIRPRPGDFCYSEDEFQVMMLDIAAAKRGNADGIVTGILRADGSVDLQRMKEIVEYAKPLKVTFHRAIDVCSDPVEALKQLHGIGIHSVLTSGQATSCSDGYEVIKQLVEVAATLDPPTTVVMGGGLRTANVKYLMESTNAVEAHGTMRKVVESSMEYRPSPVVHMGSEKMLDDTTEFQWREATPATVEAFVKAAQSADISK